MISIGLSPPSNLYRQRISEDVSHLGKLDIQALLVSVTAEETANQEKLKNPPQMTHVDGRSNIPVSQAKKKVTVVFGDTLARSAMVLVENTLMGFIKATTTAKDNQLSNKSNWQWLFIERGVLKPFPYDDNGNLMFTKGCHLVYKPVGVPHATVVNRAVARGSQALGFKMRASSSKKNPSKASQRKRNTRLGFAGATSNALKSHPVFSSFKIKAHFTSYKVAGELSKINKSVCLIISPKSRGGR